MDNQQIIESLKRIITEDLELGIETAVTSETELIELGIDSIGLMSLWVYVEESFQFEAGEDALISERFTSIGDICNYINEKITVNK